MLRKPAFWISLAVGAFLAALISGTMAQKKVRVEACIEFKGRVECRTAAGPNEQQALRTAVENACAVLASGMTESLACGATPPMRVTKLPD